MGINLLNDVEMYYLLKYTRILSLLNIMKMTPLKMIKKITVNGVI